MAVNCLHPGTVATALGKNNGGWAKVVIGMLRPFFRTPESGAATSIYLASSPQVDRPWKLSTAKIFALSPLRPPAMKQVDAPIHEPTSTTCAFAGKSLAS